jgi:hypothetical protein
VLTATGSDGHFALPGVPVGTHNLMAAMPGYLYAEKTGVEVNVETTTVLPGLTLLGGDANADCLVDIFDLVIVAVNYGTAPPKDARADINGNAAVDIFDLVMVGRNLDRTCPQPWQPSTTSKASAATPAKLRISPPQPIVTMGELITVVLALDDVSNLYGADIHLTFDPGLLEVADADSSRPGVQIIQGQFPDASAGIVTQCVADNEAGTVDYALRNYLKSLILWYDYV